MHHQLTTANTIVHVCMHATCKSPLSVTLPWREHCKGLQAYSRHSLSRAALVTAGAPIFLLDTFTQLILYYTPGYPPALPFPPPHSTLLRKTIQALKQHRQVTPQLTMLRGMIRPLALDSIVRCCVLCMFCSYCSCCLLKSDCKVLFMQVLCLGSTCYLQARRGTLTSAMLQLGVVFMANRMWLAASLQKST